jgi:ABC-type multidrug transport system ATPase subunit
MALSWRRSDPDVSRKQGQILLAAVWEKNCKLPNNVDELHFPGGERSGTSSPTPGDEKMLELDDVSHVYANGTRALDHVTLSIPRGMYGLLGPNGAGKSTLMRTVATLQTPTEGSIRFGDIDVIAQPEQLRRTLGYLPQDFGVYPRVSAYDMLDHMAVLKGIASAGDRRTTVERLLHQVNLWDVRKKALAGFSGGMRQRFGIAQALIGNPELIIVDEPTAGLDPEERNRFLNLLGEIGEQVVVILSTHIVEDVSDLCPRMAVLADGRIRLEGAPQELLAATRGTIWMKVIERDQLDACREKYELISTRLFAGKTVIHILADHDPGNGFTAVEGNLEDVYFTTLAQSRRAA